MSTMVAGTGRAFNLADSAITLGVILLLIATLREGAETR